MLRAKRIPPSHEDVLQAESSSPITQLLFRWREGDRSALEQLMPLVYDELRRLAGHYLRKERSDHTLQSTALVHEAYLRLAGEAPPEWQNRAKRDWMTARAWLYRAMTGEALA